MNSNVSMVIITGLSGAGKTASMKALEDTGFYCIDNLPPALLPAMMTLRSHSTAGHRYAIVMDVRGKEHFTELEQALDWLKTEGHPHHIVFLESSDHVLVRRFGEARREHPLSVKGSILDSIAFERQLLAPIKALSHTVIDTSDMKTADLRATLYGSVTGSSIDELMVVDLFSFGFKYGAPIDADMLFDVRFIPNPFYVAGLRPMTGLDTPCADYVLRFPVTQEFIGRVAGLIHDLLPHYSAQGKSRLTIGIGCTGGQHRSVAITEALAQRIEESGNQVRTRHREIAAGHVTPMSPTSIEGSLAVDR